MMIKMLVFLSFLCLLISEASAKNVHISYQIVNDTAYPLTLEAVSTFVPENGHYQQAPAKRLAAHGGLSTITIQFDEHVSDNIAYGYTVYGVEVRGQASYCGLYAFPANKSYRNMVHCWGTKGFKNSALKVSLNKTAGEFVIESNR